MRPKSETTTPADFPRDYGLGAVAGVQPKLVVRKLGDAYKREARTDSSTVLLYRSK